MKYDDARDLIEDGDCIAVLDSQSLLGRITQFFTRDDETHAGVAVWLEDRLFMADLNSGRNALRAVSHLKNFDVLSPPQGLDKETIRKEVFNWLAVRKDYGVLAFLVIGFKCFFKIKEKLQWRRAIVCSGGPVQIYNASGWAEDDTLISPGQLASKLKLKLEVRA